MRLRSYLVLALAVLAAAGAAGGSLLAIGGGSGSTRAPTGAETVVRVQPLEDTVACGKAPAIAYIYLDDLQFRGSPNDPSLAYGVGAFQVLLSYDPDIVRIARPIDVQLNPALNTMDADGDGLARSFAPAMSIDDGAGRALLGAFSFGPGIDVTGGESNPDRDPALNFEEGIDPEAQQEPVLLLTVGFLTVGQGTTKLSLSTPPDEMPELGTLLADPDANLYEPVVLREATLTVKGGDCPPAPPVTPRPTAEPSPAPPTPTPVIVPTPQVVTPVTAAEAGRPDCPQGWNAYGDPDDHFSFCHPVGLNITTRGTVRPELDGSSVNVWIPDPDSSFPPTTRADVAENGFFMAAGWHVDPSYNLSLNLSEYCPHSPLLIHQETSAPVEVEIAGRTAVGCVATGFDDPSYPRMKVINLVVPVSSSGGPGQGYVNLMVRYVGPDLGAAEAAGAAVIETIVIREK